MADVVGNTDRAGAQGLRDEIVRDWLARAPLPPSGEGRAAEGAGPASPEQRRMFLQHQLAPADRAETVPLAWRIRGELDADRLEESVRRMVARHDALRSTLVRDGDEVRQIVVEQHRFALRREVVEVDAHAAGGALAAAVAAAHARPMDLRRDQLCRALLVRASATDHALLVDIHHAMVDGWSLRLVAEEIWSTYRRLSGVEPGTPQEDPAVTPPPRYADYARRQHRARVPDSARRYWGEALRGAPATSSLFVETDPPERVTLAAGSIPVRIPESVVRQVHALGAGRRATPLMVLMAAYHVTVAQFAGQSDVVVCTPAARREDPEVADLVGLLVNMLPIRVAVDPAEPFTALLDRVRATLLDGLRHQELSFEDIVAASGVSSLPYRPPLAQAAIVLQDAAAAGEPVPGLGIEPIEVPTEAVRWDLVLTMAPVAGALCGYAIYRAELFNRATIASFVAAFLENLARATREPRRPVREIVRVPPPERSALLRLGDGAPVAPAADGLERLIDLAPFGPTDLMVVGPDGTAHRRREFAATIEGIEAALRARAPGGSGRIAVLLGHEPIAVAAMLAIWRQGLTFVPLDPAHPVDRLRWICADAGVTCALVSAGTRSLCRDVAGGGVELLDVTDPVTAGEPPARAPVRRTDAAYVVYTSGTTGRPKGVEATYANLRQLLVVLAALGAEGAAVNVFAPSFDGWLWSTLLPLSRGDTLRLVSAPVDAVAGIRGAAAAGAGVATVTPTMLTQLDPGLPLGVVVCAGEPLPATVAGAWAAGRRLINAYGPTEATVCSTWADSDRGDAPTTVGRPVPNVRAYLLDRAMNLVPRGAVGELYLAGAGVTRGYLGRAGLTAARYPPDPIAGDGSRAYRTGDLMRWCADGALAFVGRRDDQVKLRGIRVELGEIDATLAGVAGVAAACAVVQEAGTVRARIEAAVVPSAGTEPGGDGPAASLADSGDLRAALVDACHRRLPEAMRPVRYWWCRTLPRTSAGKLDRAAVAELLRAGSAPAPGHGAAALTERERVVAEVWESVLSRPIPDVERSFFAYGGHSLAATRVVARLRQLVTADLSVGALFRFPTVRELARYLDTLVSDDD